MPTGYTYKVIEKDIEFKDFALDCARAMGACIMLRDEPSGPVPRRLPTMGEYHQEQLEELQEELDELEKIEGKEISLYGEEEKKEELSQARKYLLENRKKEQRLTRMIQEVGDWKPPTENHEGLKKFMLDQLYETRNWDVRPEHELQKEIEDIEKKRLGSYLEERISDVHSEIEYHKEEIKKEEKLNKERQDWVDALYASLDCIDGISGDGCDKNEKPRYQDEKE